MDELTFHLEGVVRNRNEAEDFSGPLDLILLLLSKNKIEIRDIQISLLLDQYLEYLAKMQELDLDTASGFVQMAAQLMYIKTKMLLAGDKEVTELELLVSTLEQLKCRDIYTAVQAVAPTLSEALEKGFRLHTREGEPLAETRVYTYSLEGEELLGALAPLLMQRSVRHDPGESLPRSAPRPNVYGVREKSRQLLNLLRGKGSMSLNALYAICAGRSEVVATFLSVLELCAGGRLRVTGSEGAYEVSYAETMETEER
jgi:segregation and condensation protein A